MRSIAYRLARNPHEVPHHCAGCAPHIGRKPVWLSAWRKPQIELDMYLRALVEFSTVDVCWASWLLQDSLLKHGCVALLAEKLGSPDVDMRVAAAWGLANLGYGASDAARAALLSQLPAASVVAALHDQHSSVQVRARQRLRLTTAFAWHCLPQTLRQCSLARVLSWGQMSVEHKFWYHLAQSKC